MATTRAILQVFEKWEKARYDFVAITAELIVKPENVNILQISGIMKIMKPLLLDNSPKIQQLACANLSRLASYNEMLAECLINEGIIAQLTLSLREARRLSRKATTNVLKAVSKHSAAFAQAICDEGGVELLILVLNEIDPAVKEIAATTLGNIARHTPQLAQLTVDHGFVESIVPLVQDTDLPLRRSLLYSLSEIAKHTPELGTKVAESGVLPMISPLLTQLDARVKAEGCAVLHGIAKHTEHLAKVVISANVFPRVILLLKDMEPMVRRNSALVICEVCKHTLELAQNIVNMGSAPALVDNISEVQSNERLPGIMALGYLASFSPELSTTVISSNALPPLVDALANELEDHIKGASAWSLGQIGKHTPVHAKEVAQVGTILQLILCVKSQRSSKDLHQKCTMAIKIICNHLNYSPALDSLFQGPVMPKHVLKIVLSQIAKLVPHDVDLRTKLLLSGSFARIQELQFSSPNEIKALIREIGSAYPEEITNFYHSSKYKVFECKPNPLYTFRDPMRYL